MELNLYQVIGELYIKTVSNEMQIKAYEDQVKMLNQKVADLEAKPEE